MNMKSLIPLVIGLAIGGYALKLVVDTVKSAKGGRAETVNVWAAREDIPRGSSIHDAMLKAVAFPAGAIPDGAVQNKDELIGRVPRITAPANLPILDSMLLPPGAKAGLWVRPGLRAVSIRIDESSGVSNLLQPGSRVDMIGYFKVNTRGKQETVSRTLIENVEVAAVGAQINVAVEEDGKKRGVKPARAVTLFVKPQSVPVIHLAEQMGKIKLSMRNSDDDGTRDSHGISTENDVLGLPPKADLSGMADKTLLDRVKSMFQKRDREMQARLKAIEHRAVTVTQSGPPEPAWTMTIWNGQKRSDLGWKSLDSMEPFQWVPSTNQTLPREAAPQLLPVKPPSDAPGAGPASPAKESLPDDKQSPPDWGVEEHE